MMITTDVKPRTGLNTSTGQRNAPRIAGGMPVKQINSFELPTGTLQDRIDALMKKSKEQDEYNKVTEANKKRFFIGETPEASVGGSVAVLDGVAEQTRKSFNNIGGDANRLGAEKGQIENNLAADAKARQLGQYNRVEGTAGAYRTDSGNAFSGQFWQQAAIADQAQAASLEAQRNNNRISAKTAADAAGQADLALSQRYAAAQAADAQRYAATMSMIGQIAQPGTYKYWGG
jgi:hypothetical protein